MSILTEYIDKLKNQIFQYGNMTDIEIMRYVYIDLGRKMDFDLNYTFGNSKEKNRLYNKVVNEEELNRVLETHTIICKSLAYLLERILKEFDIKIRTERIIEGNKLRKTYI